MRTVAAYIILLLLNAGAARAQQTLNGKVLDDRNGQPLSGASIYFNNTSVGTLSDQQGTFALQHIPDGELIISSVGFERIIFKTGKADPSRQSFTFRLQPKENILQDIMVIPDQTKRKYLKIFRENFLGVTEEADMSRIPNLDALYFVKPPGDRDGIIALSDTPLHIINKKLGYNIQFDLGEFYFNEKSGTTSFYGFTRYDEMGDKSKWTKNRRRSYYGSTVHFFRSLLKNRLEEEGFKMYRIVVDSLKGSGTLLSSSNKVDLAIPLKASDIVQKDSAKGMYRARLTGKTMVQYFKKPGGMNYLAKKLFVAGSVPNGFRAYIHTDKESLILDENGLLEDPLSVYFSGYWVYEKAANLLPYNYIPDKE